MILLAGVLLLWCGGFLAGAWWGTWSTNRTLNRLLGVKQ